MQPQPSIPNSQFPIPLFRKTLLTLHAVWLFWTFFCILAFEEVRRSSLGFALALAAAGTLLLVGLAEFRRYRGQTPIPSRPPRFTLEVLAGLLAIAAGSYTLVAAFYMDLPNDALVMLAKTNGPLSRWVFLVACVFALTILYGALVMALASGLFAPRPKAPQLPPAPLPGGTCPGRAPLLEPPA